ncbi:hypothetical protein JW960_09725 [candidate division KSB1 bacterium]|nr:hypothetical protein [candidate division KSB1 bacterium]
MISKGFIHILWICLFIGCAAQTNLQPLGRGNLNGHASFGGPIIKVFGTRIPIPYLTTGGTYGLSRHTNITGNIHLFPLAYEIFGMDAGLAWFPVQHNGKIPTIGLQPTALLLASLKSDISDRFRIYPVIVTTAAWPIHTNQLFIGTDTTIPLTELNYDNEAASVILSPFIGYKWQLGEHYSFTTELKLHGANIRSNQLAVTYLRIGGYGAISTLFSLERRF